MIDNLRDLNDKVNAFVNYVVKTACEHTTSGQYYVSVDGACEAVGMNREDFLQYIDFVFEELASREELLEFDFDEKAMEFDVNCALNYCPHYEWCEGDEDVFECSYEEWLEQSPMPIAQPLSMSQMAEIGAGAISFLAYKEETTLKDVVKNSLCFDGDMAQAVIDTVNASERDVIAKLEATFLENDAKLKQRDAFEGSLFYQYTTGFIETVKYTNVEQFLKAYEDALDVCGPNVCTARINSDDLKIRYELDKITYGCYGEEIEPFEQWKAKVEALEKPALNDIISSCEEMSKKQDVADSQQDRNDKEER